MLRKKRGQALGDLSPLFMGVRTLTCLAFGLKNRKEELVTLKDVENR